MTQEQLLKEYTDKIEINLNNEYQLLLIYRLLEALIYDIDYYDWPTESNKLTTASLIIKDILKECK